MWKQRVRTIVVAVFSVITVVQLIFGNFGLAFWAAFIGVLIYWSGKKGHKSFRFSKGYFNNK